MSAGSRAKAAVTDAKAKAVSAKGAESRAAADSGAILRMAEKVLKKNYE